MKEICRQEETLNGLAGYGDDGIGDETVSVHRADVYFRRAS